MENDEKYLRYLTKSSHHWSGEVEVNIIFSLWPIVS